MIILLSLTPSNLNERTQPSLGIKSFFFSFLFLFPILFFFLSFFVFYFRFDKNCRLHFPSPDGTRKARLFSIGPHTLSFRFLFYHLFCLFVFLAHAPYVSSYNLPVSHIWVITAIFLFLFFFFFFILTGRKWVGKSENFLFFLF